MPAMTMSRQACRPVAQVQKPKVQAPKPQKVNMGAAAAAVFAAASLMVAPISVAADAATIKSAVCAANPTAKLCLKDSAKQQ